MGRGFVLWRSNTVWLLFGRLLKESLDRRLSSEVPSSLRLVHTYDISSHLEIISLPVEGLLEEFLLFLLDKRVQRLYEALVACHAFCSLLFLC